MYNVKILYKFTWDWWNSDLSLFYGTIQIHVQAIHKKGNPQNLGIEIDHSCESIPSKETKENKAY